MKSPLPAFCALLLLGSGFCCQAESLYGLTLDQRLVTFDSKDPWRIKSSVRLRGTKSFVTDIDVRPATNQLYAIDFLLNLYTIDPKTGSAKFLGTPLDRFGDTFKGFFTGFDFNPTVDKLRFVTDAEQNYRFNPDGTLFMTDGNLAYVAGDPGFGIKPNVSGAGYTNSVAGATATKLYYIDTVRDVLALSETPNAGTLKTVGSLGFNAIASVSFDISGVSGKAYALLTFTPFLPGQLYLINLDTGSARWIGFTGFRNLLQAIAVVPGS